MTARLTMAAIGQDEYGAAPEDGLRLARMERPTNDAELSAIASRGRRRALVIMVLAFVPSPSWS